MQCFLRFRNTKDVFVASEPSGGNDLRMSERRIMNYVSMCGIPRCGKDFLRGYSSIYMVLLLDSRKLRST